MNEDLKNDFIFHTHLRGFDFTFHTTWGLFSNRHVDDGSKMLIDHLELKTTDRVLDIGCGYGAIGLVAARLAPQGLVHMVDKDFVAIEYAKKNARVNGTENCEIYLSNGAGAVPDRLQFDCVTMNVPAHVGNEMLLILLSDAKKYLIAGGRVMIVSMARLQPFFKRVMTAQFGNFHKVNQNKTYALIYALKEEE